MPKKKLNDFEYFKERVTAWVDYFGLKNWCWTIEEECEPGEDYQARFELYRPDRLACVWYNSAGKASRCRIDRAAFHEVTEIMLDPLVALVGDGFSMNDLNNARHTIVRILENTLLEDLT